MLRRSLVLGALLAGWSLAQTPSRAHEPETGDVPELAAVRTDSPIRLDGRFDEPIWHDAPIASGFRQRNPDEGEPASQVTEVRVVYDDAALYFAIYAHDTEPSRLFAREMQRDGALFRDDSIALLLDTFHDHRNTYYLQFNANGALEDALVTDEGRDFNGEWDGVWSVVSRRVDDGWTAEVAIPFSTLRFDPELDRWGFNVRRIIRRRSEFSFWSFISLDAFVFRVSRYGHLTGIEPPEPGLNLQIKPFATGTASEAPDGPTHTELDLGLDVKWGVTRNLALDLTYNTDFAETESDNFQINLTRFSLFFPEKREFFLENAGIFRFGLGAPDLDLFFSRRIGIGSDGQEVPVDWGSRLTGRVGAWNLGLLATATAGAGDDQPATDFGVVRLRRNVGARSTIGLMATRNEPDGRAAGGSYGVDTLLRATRRLTLNAFAAGTDNPEANGQEWAAGVGMSWSGSIWFGEIESFEIGDAFDPQVGFVRRRGIRRHRADLNFQPRPKNPHVRDVRVSVEGDLVNRLDGSLESSELEIEPFGIEFESGDELRLFVERNTEDLLEPFEIHPGVVIPPGRYDFESFGLTVETASKRAIGAEVELEVGEFFDGDAFSGEIELLLRPNRHLRSETSWQRNEIELPAGSFTTNLVRERLGFAFTPTLSLNTLVQYNDVAEIAAANVRFNWIYRPGADLFVVYNQTWDAPSIGSLERRDRQLIVKFTYLIAR